MRISLEPANQADLVALVEALDAYQKPLYPAESHHGIDMDALSQVNVLFAVARHDNGKAVGCGAIVLGCGGMATLCRTLQQRLGVPVVDGVSAAPPARPRS